mgnify:CR=1 FL=1
MSTTTTMAVINRIQKKKVSRATDLNTYDVLNAQNLVLVESAVPVIEKTLLKCNCASIWSRFYKKKQHTNMKKVINICKTASINQSLSMTCNSYNQQKSMMSCYASIMQRYLNDASVLVNNFVFTKYSVIFVPSIEVKDGLIKKSTTPVASPLTIVMKKGRDPRVCIDFRERNARTETPIFPMPDVHDFLDDAAGFNLYCSFDCTKMFNQYEIVERDRHLAAFITQHGTFEPTRILFGLQGGPQHAVRSARPSMREHEYTNGQAFTRWAKQQNEESGTILYEIDPKTGIVPGSRLDMFIDDCRIAAMTPKAMVKLCELWFLF